ncbi:MAG: hydrogenase maturation protease [Acidobacteria bacterium]|nr:hydrogenase maturation protease [Acidobacteriota bacterium]
MAGAAESNACLSPSIVVLGLGNPILCDDAVGLRVTAVLRELLAAQPVAGVEILQSTRAGFELIDLLSGFRTAIIVDSLVVPEPVPGRVRELRLADVGGSARLNAVHEINLATAYQLAKTLAIPMPATVEIYAVEAAEVHLVTETMTAAVAAAVAPLARRILGRLWWLAGEDATAGATPTAEAGRSRTYSRSFYPPDES